MMSVKPVIDLDNPGTYGQIDKEGMLAHLHAFPALCRQAWQIAQEFKLPPDYSGFNKVVVLGMGGSAIGGDLVGSLVINESKVPILVCRDYNLPGYIDQATLVIASSFSGMTEETLTAFRQALRTPAKKLAVTTGGDLETLCNQNRVPVLTFHYDAQPRAALPFSFFILLGLLGQTRVVRDFSPEINGAFTDLNDMASKINENVPSMRNTAKEIAGRLQGRLAVIYGSGITAEAAHRWKGQINENSKATAFYELLSELNHNSVVGYPFPTDLPDHAFVVFLDSVLIHERNRLRAAVTRQLLDQASIPYLTVQGQGDSALSQMMTLVLLGDYVSYYLALLNRADPTPVQSISFLKKSLAEHKSV
jgi:glucose/mannose-6-phosphate isomerase